MQEALVRICGNWSVQTPFRPPIDADGLGVCRMCGFTLPGYGVRVHQQPATAGPPLPPAVSTAIRLITCHPLSSAAAPTVIGCTQISEGSGARLK